MGYPKETDLPLFRESFFRGQNRCAALNTGSDYHLLDHIAPLAALLGLPLFVTEEKTLACAKRYYPQVTVCYLPDLTSHLSFLGKEFDVLLECKLWNPLLKELFRTLYQKEMLFALCPHGQSEQGYGENMVAPYALQDRVLLYGDLQRQMLPDMRGEKKVSSYTVTGNFRLFFYQKYQAFYDRIAKEKISLNKGKKTLLYAPSGEDLSFLSEGKRVIAEAPSDWNVIMKLPPLFEERNPAFFHQLLALAEKNPRITLISDFPPVYPILALADAFLGEASSIGYDFLFFEKPLYFFPSSKKSRLHQVGKWIDPTENLYTQIETSLDSEAQKWGRELYEKVFGNVEMSLI